MPYIKKIDRIKFDKLVLEMENTPVQSTGELNYLITNLLINYCEKHGFNYKGFNDVVGVLECAKLEWYRHYIADYEEEKIMENGDVF